MQMEEIIAKRAAELSFEKIDADLLHILKRNVMDSYAGICGSLRDRTMLENFDRLGSAPGQGSELRIWGTGKKGSIYDAVFANAILARRSDLLNTYLSPNGMGGVHPSDNVALALTLADWRRMSGKELLAEYFISEETGELETFTGRLWKLEEQDDVDWLIAPLKRRLI